MADKITTFTLIKDTFFFVGSLAGLFAFIRPVSETKHKVDCEKVLKQLQDLEEKDILSLEYQVYQARAINHDLLGSLHRIGYLSETNSLDVKMNGPIRTLFMEEMNSFNQFVKDLRQYIQSPEWDCSKDDSSRLFFNKNFFEERDLDYTEALHSAATVSEKVEQSYKRLKTLTETHFLEAFFLRSICLRKKLNRDFPIINK